MVDIKLAEKLEKVIEPEIDPLLKRMGEIEAECGGFSNVPLTSEYWELRRQYHAKTRKD